MPCQEMNYQPGRPPAFLSTPLPPPLWLGVEPDACQGNLPPLRASLIVASSQNPPDLRVHVKAVPAAAGQCGTAYCKCQTAGGFVCLATAARADRRHSSLRFVELGGALCETKCFLPFPLPPPSHPTATSRPQQRREIKIDKITTAQVPRAHPPPGTFPPALDRSRRVRTHDDRGS